MEQKYKHSDLFLTHTWRKDLHGRDTHARARTINEELNRLGFATWFDEKSMTGDIKAKMAEGVDFTKSVIVFVTEQYMRKIDSPNDDNCKFEFDRALTQKTENNILCVVMEEKFDNPSNWFGKLKDTLGGCLYVSMSGDLNDKHYLKQQLKLVVEQLKSKGVVSSQTKNRCKDCTVTNKSGEQQPLFADGDACTFCGEDLKKTTDPKNFCATCNVHSNGSFCQICKVNLLGKNQRILELEEQFLKVISLQFNVDLSKYDVENFKVKIEKMKQDLVDLLVKRGQVQTNGAKLQISETEYNNKIEDLQKKMDGILTNTMHLNATKHQVLKQLEPSYNEDLSELQKSLRSLEDKRKDLDKRADQLLRAKDELQQLQKQVAEFAESAVVGQKLVHDKSCPCDDCSFERELTSKMIKDSPQYLKALVAANEIEKLKTAINLKSEIKELKTDTDLNLLLSLTFQYGTVEMLVMLLKNEIYIETEKMMDLVEIGGDENLIRTIIRNNDVEGLRKLIELQNDIRNAKDRDGSNLFLLLTVQFGRLEMFKMLLEMGCDAVTVNGYKKTLLHFVKNSEFAIVLCVKHGEALLPVKDKDGFTPFMKAYHENNTALVETMSSFVIVGDEINDYKIWLLEQQGFDYITKVIGNNDINTMATLLTFKPNMVNMKGGLKKRTPALWCCENGSSEMLKMLVDHGSAVNIRDDDGYTALMNAVIYNKTEWCKDVVEYLCTTQPQLLTREKYDGESVFHLAVRYNREDLVPILLKHSPPPQLLETKDEFGGTPINRAKDYGYDAIVEMFDNYIKEQNTNTTTSTK